MHSCARWKIVIQNKVLECQQIAGLSAELTIRGRVNHAFELQNIGIFSFGHSYWNGKYQGTVSRFWIKRNMEMKDICFYSFKKSTTLLVRGVLKKGPFL